MYMENGYNNTLIRIELAMADTCKHICANKQLTTNILLVML